MFLYFYGNFRFILLKIQKSAELNFKIYKKLLTSLKFYKHIQS
jgi:hypothetical protein